MEPPPVQSENTQSPAPLPQQAQPYTVRIFDDDRLKNFPINH